MPLFILQNQQLGTGIRDKIEIMALDPNRPWDHYGYIFKVISYMLFLFTYQIAPNGKERRWETIDPGPPHRFGHFRFFRPFDATEPKRNVYSKTDPMKNKIFLLVTTLLCSIVSSCSTDDGPGYQSDFENSRKAWLHFRDTSHNSYRFTISGGSVFTTYGWETTITVSDGKIVERKFSYTPGAEDSIPGDELEWTEGQDQINSAEHQHTAAFTALTMDGLYAKAQTDWLVKRNNADPIFESANQGMISSCGYYIRDCQDDCFRGVHVKTIEKLQ